MSNSEIQKDARVTKGEGLQHSTLVYGADALATAKYQERRLDVNEMRMCGVTRKEKIRNEQVRGSVKVAPVKKEITEKILTWYGHVKGREEGHVVR